jgi:hypothetical protein
VPAKMVMQDDPGSTPEDANLNGASQNKRTVFLHTSGSSGSSPDSPAPQDMQGWSVVGQHTAKIRAGAQVRSEELRDTRVPYP